MQAAPNRSKSNSTKSMWEAHVQNWKSYSWCDDDDVDDGHLLISWKKKLRIKHVRLTCFK